MTEKEYIEREAALSAQDKSMNLSECRKRLERMYRKLLGGHPDPRGEDGEPGIKCIDCQRDCQMIGLDMPACTAYDPPKEEA